MSLEPWHIQLEEPPLWLGPLTPSELELLRTVADALAIHELWYSEPSKTLTGNDGVLGDVREGESVAEAFARLLRNQAERQIAEREAARDRAAEVRESLRRFRGKPGG